MSGSLFFGNIQENENIPRNNNNLPLKVERGDGYTPFTYIKSVLNSNNYDLDAAGSTNNIPIKAEADDRPNNVCTYIKSELNSNNYDLEATGSTNNIQVKTEADDKPNNVYTYTKSELNSNNYDLEASGSTNNIPLKREADDRPNNGCSYIKSELNSNNYDLEASGSTNNIQVKTEADDRFNSVYIKCEHNSNDRTSILPLKAGDSHTVYNLNHKEEHASHGSYHYEPVASGSAYFPAIRTGYSPYSLPLPNQRTLNSHRSNNDSVASGRVMQSSQHGIPEPKSLYFNAKVIHQIRFNGNDDVYIDDEPVINVSDTEIVLGNQGPMISVRPDEAGSYHEDRFGDFIIDLEEFERDKALEKFNILAEMFPDAETLFLRAKCAEYALNNEAFDFFMEQMMIPGDYPRKQAEIEPIEQPEEPNNNDFEAEQKFDLQSFLKMYPDPVKHFSRNYNGARYIQHCLNYLQLRYKYLNAVTIRNVFKKNSFNLYLSDLILRKIPRNRKIPRRASELRTAYGLPPKDYCTMVTFIENETEILQYLSDCALARENAVEEARRANALLICGCCFADDLLIEEVSHCMEGHIFCKDCILRSCEVNIGDGKIDFPCLQDCTSFFELSILKDIIPEVSYKKLEKKLQEREVASANIAGLESCPFCEYAAIPPEEARIFNCENCKKQSCRLCKRVSHVPLKCSEVEDNNTKSRVYVEEKMTEALVRTCYKCKAKFIREDGCNKMICNCGAMMCYICKEPIKDYSHFYEDYHPKRRNPAGKCPLWTNNSQIHREEVNKERINAIDFQKRKNPNLDESIFKKHKL